MAHDIHDTRGASSSEGESTTKKERSDTRYPSNVVGFKTPTQTMTSGGKGHNKCRCAVKKYTITHTRDSSYTDKRHAGVHTNDYTTSKS